MASSENVEVKFSFDDQMTKAITGLSLVASFTEWLTQGNNYDRLMQIINVTLQHDEYVGYRPGDGLQMLMTQVIDAEGDADG
jgi:hypothetical protein